MMLLLNDLSFQGQFADPLAFHEAISRVMRMRTTARSFGREVSCKRGMIHAEAIGSETVIRVMQRYGKDTLRAVKGWLLERGPFWEDARLHSGDDYLTHNNDLVTNHGLAEAAFGCIREEDRRLISLMPSSWTNSPLLVSWARTQQDYTEARVRNYWTLQELEAALRAAPPPVNSWKALEAYCRTRFPRLFVSANCFDPLIGRPFVEGASTRIIELLDTLNRFRGCVDENGNRTKEGQRIYQAHFTGTKAWFSPSAENERRKFRAELNFPHPQEPGKKLCCHWHGKVKIQQIRIHFSWPVPANQPLYVVYIGPKKTKR